MLTTHLLGGAAWASLGALASAVLALAAQRGKHRIPAWQLVTQLVGTAVVLALLAARHDGHATLLFTSAFAVASIPLALEDARTRRLPNHLLVCLSSVIAIMFVAVGLIDRDVGALVRAGTGTLLCLLFFIALYAFLPSELGGGDVKLAAPLGAVLAYSGWSVLLIGLLLGWVSAAAAHLLARAIGRGGKLMALGPFLIGAALVVMIVLAE